MSLPMTHTCSILSFYPKFLLLGYIIMTIAKKFYTKPKRKFAKKAYKGKKPYRKRAGRKQRIGLRSIRVKNDGINSTFDSVSNYVTPFMLKMKKRYMAGQINNYLNLYPTQITAPVNRQNAFNFGILSNGDLIALFNNAGVVPGGAGTRANTSRIYIEKVIERFSMTNSSTSQADVDIYHFTTKRDTNCNALFAAVDANWQAIQT